MQRIKLTAVVLKLSVIKIAHMQSRAVNAEVCRNTQAFLWSVQ